jgi:hypothetical protein
MRLLLLASIFAIGSTAACLDSTGDQEQEINDGDAEDETEPSDGDIACPAIAVECPEGQVATDTDGDGCALECAEPVACPEIAVVCDEGFVPMDLDGDGCALECGINCGGPGEH